MGLIHSSPTLAHRGELTLVSTEGLTTTTTTAMDIY